MNFLCGLVLIFFMFISTYAGAGSFFWTVAGDESNGKLYLLGSIHMGDKSMYPLDPLIIEAFNGSDMLLVESSIDDIDKNEIKKYIVNHAFTGKGESIYNYMSAETGELFSVSRFNKMKFLKYKPWYFILIVSKQYYKDLGMSHKFGIDGYFINLAKKQGIPVVALESLEEQLDIFSKMSFEEQDFYLKDFLLNEKQMQAQIEHMLSCWNSGDAEGLEALIYKDYGEDEFSTRLIDALFTNRNKVMFERIERYFRQGNGNNIFVVVGAGHMLGDDGLVNLFKSKGYSVTRN